jgi:hypothetical protein
MMQTLFAQSSLSFEASQLYTSFKFKDADGTILNSDYNGIFTGAYAMNYKYITDFGLIIKGGIGMRNGGASLVYDDTNYSWKLQYAEVKPGVGYILTTGKIRPYLIASGYYAYLLRGFQTLNDEQYNITESGLLNKTDYGLMITPGVEFGLSEYIASYLELNYLTGLNNIETDEGQNAKNLAYGLTLGISFLIKNE